MIQQLEEDLKTALKARDTKRLTVLRGLKASLQNERIQKGSDLNDAEVTAVLKRERKKRHEAAETYRNAGHEDRALLEEEEATIIEEYLPQQLDEEQLVAEAEAVIEELGATSPQDMGRVMGKLSKKLEGRADNAQLARIVKEILHRE